MDLENYPLAIVPLQHLGAVTHAATAYLFSAIWTLTQSVAWVMVVQGLNWIQTLGPMILHWDSFLLGAIFLTMDISLDALDNHLYLLNLQHQPYQPAQTHRSKATASSASSSKPASASMTTISKKVTFHEQVMVLGAAAQRGPVLPLIYTAHDSSRIDPSVPLSESPTRLSFYQAQPNQEKRLLDSSVLLVKMQREEAEYHRSKSPGASVIPMVPMVFESPSSSRSSSCRSSICSVSSDNSDISDKEAKSSRSASARLAALFHPHGHQQQQRASAQHIDNAHTTVVQSADKKGHGGKAFVHRIIHPRKHKRELEQQPEQLEYANDGEYQPDMHARKNLIQRLGLKKSK
ncbi:hypothetical protein BGZ54_005975 [Gamsiella multidivaricata]|nr:hypothetical protein BGZ54_005975 [Gamsiella multidivaricata]